MTTGKSKLAEKYADIGYERISASDEYCPHVRPSAKDELEFFFKDVARRVNAKPDKNFVMDGYPQKQCDVTGDYNFKNMKKLLKYHKIKPILIFCKPEVIMARKGSDMPEGIYEVIVDWYASVSKNYDISEFECIDTTNNYRKTTYDSIMKQLTL